MPLFLQAMSSSKLLLRSKSFMRPFSEPCLNIPYILLIFRWTARDPHPEGIILIQAILEVHDIDKTVCRAADHPVSGPIAAFWKADLHRQGNRFISLVSCYCTRACMQMRVHCPLTVSPEGFYARLNCLEGAWGSVSSM